MGSGDGKLTYEQITALAHAQNKMQSELSDVFQRSVETTMTPGRSFSALSPSFEEIIREQRERRHGQEAVIARADQGDPSSLDRDMSDLAVVVTKIRDHQRHNSNRKQRIIKMVEMLFAPVEQEESSLGKDKFDSTNVSGPEVGSW